MSKLDWSKVRNRTEDPARVISVGAYGILSDQRAGRKGDPVRKPIKVIKKPSQSMLPPKKTTAELKKETARANKKTMRQKRKDMAAASPPRRPPAEIAEKLGRPMSKVQVYVRKRTGHLVRIDKIRPREPIETKL